MRKDQLKILFAGFGDIARRTTQLPEIAIHSLTAVRRSKPDDNLVNYRSGDLVDRGFVQQLFSQSFDILVVTTTPDSYTDEGYRRSYVDVAENLAAAIAASPNPPGLVIWVSSTSVYGDNNGEWVDEGSIPQPSSFSGKRLLQAEQRISGAPTGCVVLRFSGIYGRGSGRMIDKVRAGEVIAATPEIWSNRIHADDCARVISHLIDQYQKGKDLSPIYLGTDSRPAPLREVQCWLASELEINDWREYSPPKRPSRRCSNQRLLNSGFELRYPDYQSGYGAILKNIGGQSAK